MKSETGSSYRFPLASGFVIALAVLAIGLFFWQRWASHQEERARVISDTEHRAVQLAGAAAGRMSAFVRNVDFVLLQMRREYAGNDARFRAVADSLLTSFPEQSLLQLAFADAGGNVIYSNIAMPGKVNVSDREHFKVHTDGGDRLFISKPVMGRVSKQWTIQFSRPVFNGGGFAGVAVLSLSPVYVSQLLATFELAPEDTIALLNDDGGYLARNQGIDSLLGKTLSSARPFMQPGAAARGSTVNLFSEIVLNNQRSIAFSKRDHAAADSAQSAARLHTDRPAIRFASYGLQRSHQP